MARPKQAIIRDRHVSFRVSAEELFRLAAKASKAGQSPAEFARARALSGIVRERQSPARVAHLDIDTYHQVRRLGVNLNQIAHRLNALDFPPPPTLEPLLVEIRQLLNGRFRSERADRP